MKCNEDCLNCIYAECIYDNEYTDCIGEVKAEPYDFGGWMKMQRKKKGYSLTIIAKAMGVSRKTMERLERNEYSPKLDTVLKIMSLIGGEIVLKGENP